MIKLNLNSKLFHAALFFVRSNLRVLSLSPIIYNTVETDIQEHDSQYSQCHCHSSVIFIMLLRSLLWNCAFTSLLTSYLTSSFPTTFKGNAVWFTELITTWQHYYFTICQPIFLDLMTKFDWLYRDLIILIQMSLTLSNKTCHSMTKRRKIIVSFFSKKLLERAFMFKTLHSFFTLIHSLIHLIQKI